MKPERKKYINSVNLNIDTDFPYLVLEVINDSSYPMNPGFQVMHWHEDLQFIYVLSGTIEVRTLDAAVRIKAGEGIFINKNIVHYVGRIGNCHYNSFLFPSCFLEFYPGSPAKTFVEDITEKESIPFYPLTSEGELSVLRELTRLEKNKSPFYAYEVLVLLSTLWLAMRQNIIPAPEKPKSAVNSRMERILHYIGQHYGENLSLADLAKSANISKSECSRCFKLSLNTTPYKYLLEFRLLKAAELLENTNESIGNIAASVGFHQTSHFGKCFREKTGYAPKAYRRMKQADCAK